MTDPVNLVPAVVDALIGRVRGSDDPRIPRLQVFDGPEPGEPEREYLAVGVTDENLTSPTQRTPAGLTATTASVDVPCSVRVWAGDLDLPVLRRRAYTVHDAVVDLVEADRTLGGACSTAEVTGSDYQAALMPERGYVVDVTFTVRATRF